MRKRVPLFIVFISILRTLRKTGMKFSTKEEGEGCNLKISYKPTFPVILYVEGLEKKTGGKTIYKTFKHLAKQCLKI